MNSGHTDYVTEGLGRAKKQSTSLAPNKCPYPGRPLGEKLSECEKPMSQLVHGRRAQHTLGVHTRETTHQAGGALKE